MTQDEHGRGTRHVVVGQEHPSQQRLHAQCLKEVPGDDTRANSLRLTVPQEVEVQVVVLDHLLEVGRLGAIVLDLEG
jgi:hypothetical protein